MLGSSKLPRDLPFIRPVSKYAHLPTRRIDLVTYQGNPFQWSVPNFCFAYERRPRIFQDLADELVRSTYTHPLDSISTSLEERELKVRHSMPCRDGAGCEIPTR